MLKCVILSYILGILLLKRKQAHILRNANFEQKKIADKISDFLVEIVGVEPATS